MKKMNLQKLALIFISFVFIAGCGKDEPTPEVSPLVGDYVISHAEVSQTFEVTTVQFGVVPVEAGSDITDGIQASLLGAVSCGSASKSYIELRSDKSMYMSCEKQNPLNAGTWEELSETSIKLNMNHAAIPTSPTGFVLTVTEVTLVNKVLTGKTSVPLPKAMLAGMIAPLTLDPSTPDVLMVSFQLELQKK